MTRFQRAQVETVASRLAETPERIITIFGPRQSGKTTAAHQTLEIVPRQHRFLAIDQQEHAGPGPSPGRPGLLADRPAIARPGRRPDVEWLIETWSDSRRRAWDSTRGFVLVLDEIQRIEGWSDAVKGLWDADRASGCPMHVVIMGSVPLLMQSGLNESLAAASSRSGSLTGRMPRWRTRSVSAWTSTSTSAATPARHRTFTIRCGGSPTSRRR